MKLNELLDEKTAVRQFAHFDQCIQDQGSTLDLHSQNLGDKDIPYLCEYLKRNQTIDTLDLQHNNIGPDGATYFSLHNQTIKNLDLNVNRIGDEGCDALIRRHPNLTGLRVEGNNISDRGVSNIHLNTTLTYLKLVDNFITDNGAVYLSRSPTLTWLILRMNAIGEAGASALESNQNLEFVDMYSQRPVSKPIPYVLEDRLLKLNFRNDVIKQNYLKELTSFLFEYILPDIARIILQYKDNDIVPIYFEAIQNRMIVQRPRPADLKAAEAEIKRVDKLLSKLSLSKAPPDLKAAEAEIKTAGKLLSKLSLSKGSTRIFKSPDFYQ